MGEYFVSGREINREEERMFAKNGTKQEVFSETFDNFFPRMFKCLMLARRHSGKPHS